MHLQSRRIISWNCPHSLQRRKQFTTARSGLSPNMHPASITKSIPCLEGLYGRMHLACTRLLLALAMFVTVKILTSTLRSMSNNIISLELVYGLQHAHTSILRWALHITVSVIDTIPINSTDPGPLNFGVRFIKSHACQHPLIRNPAPGNSILSTWARNILTETCHLNLYAGTPLI